MSFIANYVFAQKQFVVVTGASSAEEKYRHRYTVERQYSKSLNDAIYTEA